MLGQIKIIVNISQKFHTTDKIVEKHRFKDKISILPFFLIMEKVLALIILMRMTTVKKFTRVLRLYTSNEGFHKYKKKSYKTKKET